MDILNEFANTDHNQGTTNQRGPARAKTRNRRKTRILGFLLSTVLAGLLLWPALAKAQQPTAADEPLSPNAVLETAPLTGIVQVAASGYHTCALTESGGVQCWGLNHQGQLGDGTTEDRLTPVDVVGLGSSVTAIAARGSHTCALTGSGGLQCWGFNYFGQLGDGTTVDRLTPVDVVGLGNSVTAIAAGGHHTCALTRSRGTQCWGFNEYGQLGDGTYVNRDMPTNVAELGSDITAIATGFVHTCALTTNDEVKCWGRNYGGQLGDETIPYFTTPQTIIDGVGCHRLNRSHHGGGQDPSLSLPYSEDCNVGEFVKDEVVTISASPFTLWRVAGWSGTDDDDSTAMTNTFTMPDQAHTVSVIYELRDDLTSTFFPLMEKQGLLRSLRSPSGRGQTESAIPYVAVFGR